LNFSGVSESSPEASLVGLKPKEGTGFIGESCSVTDRATGTWDKRRGVSHFCLAIYIKKYLKAKEVL
jgi:hypothetical protein